MFSQNDGLVFRPTLHFSSSCPGTARCLPPAALLAFMLPVLLARSALLLLLYHRHDPCDGCAASWRACLALPQGWALP